MIENSTAISTQPCASYVATPGQSDCTAIQQENNVLIQMDQQRQESEQDSYDPDGVNSAALETYSDFSSQMPASASMSEIAP